VGKHGGLCTQGASSINPRILARTRLLKERGWDMAAGQNTAAEDDSRPAGSRLSVSTSVGIIETGDL
jgi:hypothetical protein